MLLVASCAAPGSLWRSADAPGTTCFVESGLDPALALDLTDWIQEDLLVLSNLLGVSIRRTPIEVWCGTPQAEGGHLRLGSGESGRHVSRPGRPCRLELAAVPRRQLRTYLRHELVHHLLEEGEYPEWLNEGLAEYLAFALAAPPSAEDVHQLLHAGLVLSGWGRRIELTNSEDRHYAFTAPIWLPDLPELMRMTYDDYRTEVLELAGTRDPEFHAASQLLARLLLTRTHGSGITSYAKAVRDGADPWEAFLTVTRFEDREAVLDALTGCLAEALAELPAEHASLREFAWGSCLHGKLPAWLRDGDRRAVRIEAFPGGPEVALPDPD